MAQAGPLEHAVLVQESAAALGRLHQDPAGVLLSCRRLLERHAASGPLWWLCASVVCAEAVGAEAWRCVEALGDDPTARWLAAEMPSDATVALVGWPEVTAEALYQRGDLQALAVNAGGEGARLAGSGHIGVGIVEVHEAGLGPAVVASDLVVLEASAVGPRAFVAAPGSRAAAAVARAAGLPVWLVAGVGRVLPRGLWAALCSRLVTDRPWDAPEEIVPLDMVDEIIRPDGRASLAVGVPVRADCSEAPELS